MPLRRLRRRNTKPRHTRRKTSNRKIAGKRAQNRTLTSKVNRLITLANRKTNWLQYEYPQNDENTYLATSSLTSYANAFNRQLIRPTEWTPIFQSEGNFGQDCKEFSMNSLRVQGCINLNQTEGDCSFMIAIVSPKGILAEQTRDRLQGGTGSLVPDEDFVVVNTGAEADPSTGNLNPYLVMLNRKKFHIHFQKHYYMSSNAQLEPGVGGYQQGGQYAPLRNQKRFFNKYIKFQKRLRNETSSFEALGTGDLNPKSTVYVVGFTNVHNLTPSADSNPSLNMNVIINGKARN